MTELVRPNLTPPNAQDKLLLHSCCAPCSGEPMEAMLASGIDFTIFFYNPNIHPQKEYELRKDENIRFAQKHGVPFIDADYDTTTGSPAPRDGERTGARRALHRLLRHALRAHRALCA